MGMLHKPSCGGLEKSIQWTDSLIRKCHKYSPQFTTFFTTFEVKDMPI